MEHLILSCCVCDRTCFELARKYGYDRELSAQGTALFEAMADYYDKDHGAREIHGELFLNLLEAKYGDRAQSIIDTLEGLDENPPTQNYRALIVEGQQAALRQRMVESLMEQDTEAFNQHLMLYTSLEGEANDDGVEYAGVDPFELIDGQYHEIPILPAGVDRAYLKGGLVRKHQVILYGRPEMGKSLTVVNMVKAAAEAGFRVGLWENEDPAAITALRIMSCMTGLSDDEMKKRPKADVEKMLRRAGWYDKVFVKESPAGTVYEITQWAKDRHLDLVIVNQFHNLSWKSDNEVLRVRDLAQALRGMAKSLNLCTVLVTQAGESATGRAALRTGDVDWSNTGVPAQCDVLLGIGADDQMEMVNKRQFSFPKNKCGLTHKGYTVDIDPVRNQMRLA